MQTTLNVNDLKPLGMITVKVKVTGLWWLKLRIKIATLLIAFACWFASIKCEVREDK